jgi:hypothetical protein
MQLFGKEAKPSSKSRGNENPVTNTPPPKIRQGRERLQYYVDQIAAAHNAIEELEQHCARLGAIIVESDTASRDLQNFIAADSGLALSRYSGGQCGPDEEISRLVAHSKTSGDAAEAAKAGLPHAESLLATAKQQLVTLTEEKHAEVARVIASLADVEVRAYEKSFEATCLLQDRLIGFSRVGESNVGDVYRIQEPARLARFVANGDSTSDPFIRHHTNEHIVSQSAQRWAEIRSRLELNANCDLADLEIRNHQ